MKKPWLIVLIIFLAIALVGAVVKVKFLSKPSAGALQISSEPRSIVFLNDSQVGITPYFDEKLEAGNYRVKLVPESGGEDLGSWENQIVVSANILTVINRSLAKTESVSSGEILSLEKYGEKDASSLAVVSLPDKAVVKIDGEPRGFSPVIVDLVPGAHQLAVSAPGYEERAISANTVAGYKLTANVKLAQIVEGIDETPDEDSGEESEDKEDDEDSDEDQDQPAVTPSAATTPSPKTTPKTTVTPPAKPYVVIKETPTGWLRVRSEPDMNGEELAKVNTGEMFPYLDKEENGWYQIEYEEGEEGWISGTYADLVD